MLKSDLCDYSDACIVVKERISSRTTENTDIGQKDIVFRNNAPFRLYKTKLNSTSTDNAEDLDIAMPMSNLLEYNKNYSMTSGSLRNYYRDEIDDVDNNASDGKSFKYNTRTTRSKTYTTSTNRSRWRWKSTTTTNTTTNIAFKHRSHYSAQIS